MSNPDKKLTSHGHGGDTEPTPVPSHKSYGGTARDEVAGGPAGRGNDTTADMVDTASDWGRGEKQGLSESPPVSDKTGATPKNSFSK